MCHRCFLCNLVHVGVVAQGCGKCKRYGVYRHFNKGFPLEHKAGFLTPPLSRRHSPLSLYGQRGPSARSLPDSMQMLCTRNEDIIVAVFFDVKTCVTTSTENQSSVRQFLNQASVSLACPIHLTLLIISWADQCSTHQGSVFHRRWLYTEWPIVRLGISCELPNCGNFDLLLMT